MVDTVVALEEDAGLAAVASTRLKAQGASNVEVRQGALSEGCAKEGPFDRIILEGAVEEIPPTIVAQLKDGGRVAAIRRYVERDELFCLTYGDGVSDVNLTALVDAHRKSGKVCSVTAVPPKPSDRTT